MRAITYKRVVTINCLACVDYVSWCTGVLDAATREKMAMPRCGHRDVVPTDVREKRYQLHGTSLRIPGYDGVPLRIPGYDGVPLCSMVRHSAYRATTESHSAYRAKTESHSAYRATTESHSAYRTTTESHSAPLLSWESEGSGEWTVGLCRRKADGITTCRIFVSILLLDYCVMLYDVTPAQSTTDLHADGYNY